MSIIIFRVIWGIVILFLPGYFVSRAIIKKSRPAERFVLTFAFTFIISSVVGILLTVFTNMTGVKAMNLLTISIINVTIAAIAYFTEAE